MTPQQPTRIECPKPNRAYYYFNKQCGGERNCLPDQGYAIGFHPTLCILLKLVSLGPQRYGDIWDNPRKKHLAHVTYNWTRGRLAQSCPNLQTTPEQPAGANAGPEPFTIDIPGIQDILKVKDWESKQLKRERYERFKTRNSPVPEILQWIPPLLTKLDNAQDLLFTGLALLYPILRFTPKFLLGPLGWILTINDFINILT